jgi:TetR/AcrR family transcriptional regulator, fatty acid metabolism regulator protein
MISNKCYTELTLLNKRSDPPGKLKLIAGLKYLLKRKNFNSITTAEIAKKAKTYESLIYWHFKDKNGMLHQIVGEYLLENIALINSEMQKIKSPLDKLKKLIWLSFYILNKKRIYAKIILIEVKSVPDYFKSQSYLIVQKFSAIVEEIIKEGIANGMIRDDIQPIVLTNIIFGGIQYCLLPAIIFNMKISPEDCTEDLFKILLYGIVANGEKKKNARNRKKLDANTNSTVNISDNMQKPNHPKGKRKREPSGKIKLAEAMRQLLENKDFYSISTNDISTLAKKNEALIYRYFGDKRGLLYHVLANYLEEMHERILGDLKAAKGSINRLKIIISDTFDAYCSQRVFAKIILLEVRNSSDYFESYTFKLVRRYVQLIVDTIGQGVVAGEISNDLSPQAIRNIIIGGIEHIVLHSLMFNRDGNPDVFLENLLEVVLHGIFLKNRLKVAA